MKRFVSLPVIDSSLYLFGGHMRTVPGGWQFFEQKHQMFELMVVIEGRQTTEIKNLITYDYGAGEAIIISPGTIHTNQNSSLDQDMTYICFHFNIENLELKSEIISKIANTVISADQPIAKSAVRTAKQMVTYSSDQTLSQEQINLKIQITVLEFFYSLTKELQDYKTRKKTRYTENEAKTSRQIATLIKKNIERKEVKNFTFGDVCKKIGISCGYGHRTFKKVYGVTPLHYIESQKYNKAKMLLGSPEQSIEDVADLVGASSVSNFSKQFKKWSGITPSKYQRQMKKQRRVRTIKGEGYFE